MEEEKIMNKEKFQLTTKKIFLAKETSRIEEVAKKVGIIIPSTHTAIFQSVYAPIEEANANKVRLAKKAVEETLPNLIGSQANLNHLGKNWMLGVILDAWVDSDTEDINIIFSFAKNIFEKEYTEALEAMAEDKLTVSFELMSDLKTAEKLNDGTVRLHDIDWQGVGVLIGKKPAYKNAVVYEMAEQYLERARELDKELLFASKIVENIQLISEDLEDDLLDVQFNAEKWTKKYINDLPNSSFAVIESDYLEGKTKNKNARHLPFKNKEGNIDLPHYRNALARVTQIIPVTESISTDELRRRAITELSKHKNVLETAETQGGVNLMNEEQKKLVAQLRAELDGFIPAETKDEELLDEKKVAEFRKAKEDKSKEAEQATKKETVAAEAKKLSVEKYTTVTTYKDDGSVEVSANKECTYEWTDAEGKTQSETLNEKTDRVMKYAEEDMSDVKSKLSESEKKITELNATLEKQAQEIADFKAKEQAQKDAELKAKIDEIKASLKDNKYVANFKDEDYLDEKKVKEAKILKENDDLKAENEALKKKEPVKAEEKTEITTGHSDEVVEMNPRKIISKLGKKQKK